MPFTVTLLFHFSSRKTKKTQHETQTRRAERFFEKKSC